MRCHGSGGKKRFHFFRKKWREKKGDFIVSTRKPFPSPYDQHIVEHVIAFLGNPNVGKSSLFNLLTGSHQHIGNWPGKTVEKKVGDFILGGEYFSLVDLPGSYSLNARSEEEEITRDFIVKEKPDLICAIIDATRLERTMYIAMEAMELTKNVAIVINMADLLEKEGMKIDVLKLQKRLGVPVLLVSAVKKDTLIHFKKFLYDALHTKKYTFTPPTVVYSPAIEQLIVQITKQIEKRETLRYYPTRWVAIKILEGDESIIRKIEKEFDLTDLKNKIKELKEHKKIDPAVEISRTRYNILRKVITPAVKGYAEFKEKLSDRVDKIVLHPFWGYPILILIYAAFFGITFYATSPILNWLDFGIGWISNQVMNSLESINTPSVLSSLIVDGVLAGIGAVVMFFPIIFIFYTLIAIMEDSGYLARSAYLMDRFMGLFRIQGTAFLSLVMGFGCNVAGVMATRTIKNRADRLSMIINNSFIPCAARLGVIAFLTSIFFKPWVATLIMLALYGTSISIVLLSSLMLSFFFSRKEERIPLILELPEYRKPRLRNIYYLTWERAGVFVKKAGTFIFLASIFIWFVANTPFGAPPEKTIVGYIGRWLSIVTYPLMGIDWKMVIPLIFGVAAKETIISGLSIVYETGGKLITVLKASWTFAQTISFIFFQTFYMPCFATMAIVKAESGKWKYTLFAIFYPLILTSILTTILYQLLKLV